MGPDTMHHNLVSVRAAAAAIVLVTALGGRPAFAQAELTGSWGATNNEDLSGDSLPVDYTGLALTDEARVRALSYNESQLAMIERQCQGWPAFYFAQGPFGLKIWSDIDQTKGEVVSYTVGAWEDRAPLVIWMDNRPHPSELAEHTRRGNTLVAYTTHMKAGFVRKTGPPNSDRATMTARFYRHGDILTVLAVVEDPIYLAEPFILTKSFQLTTQELATNGPPCVSAYQGRVPGESVPHYIPEQNPFIDEMTTTFGVPRDAALGVPETTYPEYRKKMKKGGPPGACTINCVQGAPPSNQ